MNEQGTKASRHEGTKSQLGMNAEHFIDLAIQGKRRGCSSGEHNARALAMTFLRLGLSLDDAAVDGFIDFIHMAKRSPTTVRDLIG